MNQITTLLLAWRLAKKFNEDEALAIRKCAKKLISKTTNAPLRALFVGIVNSSDDEKCIEVVQRLEFGADALALME